jgi:adenylate cyclase
MVDGGELYGDGVNIANRLQSLAEPGGIRISGNEYDYVRNKLPVNCVELGKQQLKNIDEPVRVYRVLEGSSVAPANRHWRSIGGRRTVLALATLVLVVGAAVAAWQFYPRSSGPLQEASQPSGAPLLPDRPSIVVLPFQNLSGDPEQEYFSDGLVNDITTDLSKFANLFVIAAYSAFHYKNKPMKVQDIGHELGVRYALEGSVQREGNRIRVNAQLTDTARGVHLWAERYDRELKDVFSIQDELIGLIVKTLAIKVSAAEGEEIMANGTDNPTAYDLWLKGRSIFTIATNKEQNQDAQKLFEAAITADPKYADPHADLARTYGMAAVVRYPGRFAEEGL